MNQSHVGNLKALEGIRVLDLSRVLAGPFCTMILADMGAEVIKLEVPVKGDDSRTFPPFKDGESAYFINFNRNKKSIVLDLKNESDIEKFRKIVESMDVLVENFRPGTMERMGLGYEELCKINERLIFASISGFGQYGPYKHRPGYDIIGQAASGLMSITGWPDGPPTRTGTAITDIMSALFCTVGILSALQARSRYGKGQKIDVSIIDSAVCAIAPILQIYLVENRIPARLGNRYEFLAPYEAFKAKDGWFVLGIGNDSIWKAFCTAIKRDDLLNDERFDTNAKRLNQIDVLYDIVSKWAADLKVEEIVSLMEKNRVPAASINNVDQIVTDPHIAVAREMIQSLIHPVAGKIQVTGNPIKMNETNPQIFASSPLLGEHTEEILKKYISQG
jgi:formyl-CoA transferase